MQVFTLHAINQKSTLLLTVNTKQHNTRCWHTGNVPWQHHYESLTPFIYLTGLNVPDCVKGFCINVFWLHVKTQHWDGRLIFFQGRSLIISHCPLLKIMKNDYESDRFKNTHIPQRSMLAYSAMAMLSNISFLQQYFSVTCR